jgi:hypothetical protein
MKPPVTASDAASSIHQAVTKLREAVTEQQELLASLNSVSSQYQDSILSQQLADLAVTAPADLPAMDSSHPTAPVSSDAAAATAMLVSVRGISEDHQESLHPDTAAMSATAMSAFGKLQPEELALLMDAVIIMLEQELQLMVSQRDLQCAPPLQSAVCSSASVCQATPENP